jgi:hypothetical protein
MQKPYLKRNFKNMLKDILLLTLATYFLETFKLWANIYYALLGLECQG